MRRLAAILTLASLFLPTAHALAWNTDFVDPQRLLADEDLTDTATMSKQDLTDLFARGYLGSYKTKDIHGIKRSAVDIVWRAAQSFDLNPRFLAVLLQREQSLVENDHPTKDQLDWAMGYSICDSCKKNDPRLKKYKGFGQQVYYAAKKISEDYLADLHAHGRTASGIGVGIPMTIDGTPVTPKTMATAILYTYTPHLNGNANFARIWNRWFTPEYPSGSLVQEKSGAVWLIRNGERHPIASKTVLATSFANRPLVAVHATALNAYPVGSSMRYPNYSLLRTPDGGVYLIVDDMVRVFSTPEIVAQIGFDPSEIVDVGPDDLKGYVEGPPIDDGTVNPQIQLFRDPANGGIYAVEDNVKHPIPSPEVLKARFGTRKVQAGKTADLAELPTGAPVAFPDGVLVSAKGSKDIYVISNGQRRLVVDAKALAAYGWNKKQVIQTDEKTLNLQPQGEDIRRPVDDASPINTASN